MSAPAKTVETVKIKVNGKELDAPKDQPVLQTCLDNGIYIPHYCYHPALSISGNCRMCLCTASNAPKAVISCATFPAEGAEYTTESEEVKKLREIILEFLLINHPLDCPVCDQAGECDLQEFSFRFGKDDSRFEEEKNYRHTKKLGTNVRLYGNRCIVCTRCVRFCEEIAGDAELCVRERGDSNIIDTFPGIPLENPISGCVADICPVGALFVDDFVHKTRVFFLESTTSVCNMCATGCSINVDTWQGEVQRLRPRHNPDVNDYWMCDRGRVGYKYSGAAERLSRYEVGPARAGSSAGDGKAKAGPTDPPRSTRAPSDFGKALAAVSDRAERVRREHGPGAFAFVASAWMSVEEMFLFRRLATTLAGAVPGEAGPATGILAVADGEAWTPRVGGAFKIDSDRNPNRKGAEMLLLGSFISEPFSVLLDRLESGAIKFAWVVGGIPDFSPMDRFRDALGAISNVVVTDILPGPLSERATILLPAASFVEKDGVFVNGRGWAQRCRAALPPPGETRTELDLFQELLRRAGERERVLSAQGVYAELAAEVGAFADTSYKTLGALGARVTDDEPAEREPTGREAAKR